MSHRITTMQQRPTVTLTEEGLLTIEQIALRLQISESSIRRMMDKKDFPHLYLSDQLLRFSPVAVGEWLADAHVTRRRERRKKESGNTKTS